MIEEWILQKIEPLKPASPIIVRDPQRILQRGAQVIDGWAKANGYSVFFCTGNLGLREMVEASRDEPGTQILVVDRSRKEAAIPLFYPDLMARTKPNARLELTLCDYLREVTGDPHWPRLVEERTVARLVLENLEGTLAAHRYLRAVEANRFTDTDLYKIVLGAVLKINPFRKLSAADARRLAIGQHDQLEELNRLLPRPIMASLHEALAAVPKPFCWLLTRDPELVVRSFTLAALLHQHKLDYRLLLTNLDPLLHDYRDIDAQFIQKSVEEQVTSDAERLLADVAAVEHFLAEQPDRLHELLRDHLQVDSPKAAYTVLKAERLSELVRSLALLSLLADLLQNRNIALHEKVQSLLEKQGDDADLLALRRPTERWQSLVAAHRQALITLRLAIQSVEYAKQLQVTPAEQLDFAQFHRYWNEEKLNRLDYYTSDLKRVLRVGDILPVALHTLWPELQQRWTAARTELEESIDAVEKVQQLLNHRFQDLYQLHYATWIQQADAPVIFTHQVLDRLLKAHWDPQSGQKAVILVFDGLRTDAWDEFLRPVFEERFALVESRPGSAILPTETHLSRKAIAAGCLPTGFIHRSELVLLQSWLKQHMGLSPSFATIKDDDTTASGMTARFSSDLLDYIIFNFSDKNLHDNPQDLAFIYNTTLREIIRQDVRSVLRELPANALLIITSDHGFTPVPTAALQIPAKAVISPHDVKYRSARTVATLSDADAKQTVAFDAATLGIPTESEGHAGKHFRQVLFPRPNVSFKRPQGRHAPDPYNHGGLSLAECMVPMVVMGPKQTVTPLLVIRCFAQKSIVREGEEVVLEIEIAGNQAKSTLKIMGKTITLKFSDPDLAERREFFPGEAHTYRIRWQPTVTITPKAQEAGEVLLPLTVVLQYSEGGMLQRISQSTTVRITIDNTRLRRRVDSKLNLLMGAVPKGLRG
ncbi:MAG: hypothetical protein R3C14_19560 [Caldilineaceae bacterium]